MVKIGILLGLASALLWSLANLAITGSSRRFGAFAALVSAQIWGIALALPAAFCFEGIPAAPGSRGLLWIVFAAVVACLAYGGLFDCLQRGKLSVCAPIVSAWSAIACVQGLLFYGERPGPVGITGIVLVVVGNVVLGRSSGDRGGAGQAIGSAIVSAIGFGCLVPATHEVGLAIGPVWAVPAIWGTELLIAIPLLLAAGRLGRLPRGGEWRRAALPGLLEVAGFLALSVGSRVAPITEVAPASSLTTAFSVAIGLLILRERLRPAAGLGALAACVGVILVNF